MKRENEADDLSWARECLGHQFSSPALLKMALTHSSWANEAGRGHAGPKAHNERLEFLGDAVLELCVSDELFRRFPDAREGVLTRMRSKLVDSKSLAKLARVIGLDKWLKLGKGEESQGGRGRDSVLSDALEALVAAIYEDGGYEAAQKAVCLLFAGQWPDTEDKKIIKDCKSSLQEIAQARFKACPRYILQESSGPEHCKLYLVRLEIPDGRIFLASGSSRKKAEQEAACAALAELGQKLAPLPEPPL